MSTSSAARQTRVDPRMQQCETKLNLKGGLRKEGKGRETITGARLGWTGIRTKYKETPKGKVTHSRGIIKYTH